MIWENWLFSNELYILKFTKNSWKIQGQLIQNLYIFCLVITLNYKITRCKYYVICDIIYLANMKKGMCYWFKFMNTEQ